jgi:hypothetical protein
MDAATAVGLFLKLLADGKLSRRLCAILILVVGGVLLYYGAGYLLTGASAMWNVNHWVFLAVCGLGGLAAVARER